MHAEKSLNRICKVWRSAILHENCAIHTSALLQCWNELVSQKRFITRPIDCTGYRTRRTNLVEKECPYDKRCRNPAPHSNFIRMKRYGLTSERTFRCPYSAILSADISIDMKVSFI
ncbi:hypothetical protein AVEN_73929-1 [Araneus ventricosus]|uniref:Uncharacterized protein n=1 Tax=Araneus ventricosus TaxID=182803 RepID=A0A4Y2T506_ARAVE|nr:hypothetical protein AVEN_73929-1 [Araneus ventricosus]